MHHKMVDFIDCALTKHILHLSFSPSLPLFLLVALARSAALPLPFCLTLPTTASCLCLLQFQSPSAFPSLTLLCDGRSQPRCNWREYRWSKATESRLWCKRPGSWAEHSLVPKRQYPAAPHYTPSDHRSHPEQGGEAEFSPFIISSQLIFYSHRSPSFILCDV